MYKSHIVDYNNHYDNLYDTIVVYDDDRGRDTGILDQNGYKILRYPDKIKLGFDTKISQR